MPRLIDIELRATSPQTGTRETRLEQITHSQGNVLCPQLITLPKKSRCKSANKPPVSSLPPGQAVFVCL